MVEKNTIDSNKGRFRDWMTYVQLSVPIILFLFAAYVHQVDISIGDIKRQVGRTYDMLFTHVTNEEMHSPRSLTITRPEFDLYQSFRDRQMSELKGMQIRQGIEIKNGFEKIEDLIVGKK